MGRRQGGAAQPGEEVLQGRGGVEDHSPLQVEEEKAGGEACLFALHLDPGGRCREKGEERSKSTISTKSANSKQLASLGVHSSFRVPERSTALTISRVIYFLGMRPLQALGYFQPFTRPGCPVWSQAFSVLQG